MGSLHFIYVCVNNNELNYDTYLDPDKVQQWPEPLRLMSDYILSDEFVSLVLALHRDIFKVEHEDAPIQPGPKMAASVDNSWANWKDWKDRKSSYPQPKDDLEDEQEWLPSQHTEDTDYFLQ